MSEKVVVNEEYASRDNGGHITQSKDNAGAALEQASHRTKLEPPTWNEAVEQILNERADLWKRLADR